MKSQKHSYRAVTYIALIMLFALALVLSSCKPALPPQLVKAVVGEPLVLHIGETALVSATDYGITLEEILSDSRCPANVMCIQQGSAKVKISVTLNGAEQKTVVLDTQVDTSFTYDQLTVHLNAVQPYPGTVEQKVLDSERTVSFLLELNPVAQK